MKFPKTMKQFPLCCKPSNLSQASTGYDSFTDLVRTANFGLVHQILTTERLYVLRQWLEEPEKNSNDDEMSYSSALVEGETCLHYIVKFQPPADLVRLLIQRLYEIYGDNFVPQDATDNMGRTPLHTYAVCARNLRLLHLLMCSPKYVVSAALTKDNQNRYPLHWACDRLLGSNPNATLVIQSLITAHPGAVLVRDTSRRTPREWAILRKASPSVLTILQDAELDVWSSHTKKVHEREPSEGTASTTIPDEIELSMVVLEDMPEIPPKRRRPSRYSRSRRFRNNQYMKIEM